MTIPADIAIEAERLKAELLSFVLDSVAIDAANRPDLSDTLADSLAQRVAATVRAEMRIEFDRIDAQFAALSQIIAAREKPKATPKSTDRHSIATSPNHDALQDSVDDEPILESGEPTARPSAAVRRVGWLTAAALVVGLALGFGLGWYVESMLVADKPGPRPQVTSTAPVQ